MMHNVVCFVEGPPWFKCVCAIHNNTCSFKLAIVTIPIFVITECNGRAKLAHAAWLSLDADYDQELKIHSASLTKTAGLDETSIYGP